MVDRHALPKVALAFISVASLIGTLLTMNTHRAPWGLAVVRWLHLISLAVLAGGAMWWGFFVRPFPSWWRRPTSSHGSGGWFVSS